MKSHRYVTEALILIFLAGHGQAAIGDPDRAEAGAEPCSSADHRAFDFWLGEWRVTSPERPDWQAASTIGLANNGCSIHESYRTPAGYAGRSINFFDSSKKRWHQTWVDNQGAPLYLEGNVVDGAMVLSDVNNRITWSLQADQRVRQHWETSKDGGEHWETVFDGYYSSAHPPVNGQ